MQAGLGMTVIPRLALDAADSDGLRMTPLRNRREPEGLKQLAARDRAAIEIAEQACQCVNHAHSRAKVVGCTRHGHGS